MDVESLKRTPNAAVEIPSRGRSTSKEHRSVTTENWDVKKDSLDERLRAIDKMLEVQL